MPKAQKPKYKRIILKFSGEAFAGKNEFGIDFAVLQYISKEIKPLLAKKVQVGIIVGGGNLFRGANLTHLERVTGDQIGMLATLLNSLALQDTFKAQKIPVQVMSALPVSGIIPAYDRNLALQSLEQGKALIFAGGTGNPFVTTDTALALRGVELDADLLLKATNVAGVYSENPTKNPKAKFFPHLTYQEALTKKLQVMDLSAFSLCSEHNKKLRVYNMHKAGVLLAIVCGANEGTLVSG